LHLPFFFSFQAVRSCSLTAATRLFCTILFFSFHVVRSCTKVAAAPRLQLRGCFAPAVFFFLSNCSQLYQGYSCKVVLHYLIFFLSCCSQLHQGCSCEVVLHYCFFFFHVVQCCSCEVVPLFRFFFPSLVLNAAALLQLGPCSPLSFFFPAFFAVKYHSRWSFTLLQIRFPELSHFIFLLFFCFFCCLLLSWYSCRFISYAEAYRCRFLFFSWVLFFNLSPLQLY
jgi:hypothetical protein